MKQRDYVREIEQKRERGQMHPGLAPSRVKTLKDALARVSSNDRELFRYFPVALAATVEAFVRRAVQEILDRRTDLFDAFLRTSFAKDAKFNLAVLGAVGGKRVSAGEIVGHLISVKGIPDIENVLRDVTGTSFLGAVRTVHDRFAVEVMKKPKVPIIADLDSVLATLADVFKFRHILAHEAPERVDLNRDVVAKHIEGVAAFIDAAAEVVTETVHPGHPLTQADMHHAASDAAGIVIEAMEADLQWLGEKLPERMREALAASQSAWKGYCDKEVEFEGLEFGGGSLAPTVMCWALESLVIARREQLKRVAHIPDRDAPIV